MHPELPNLLSLQDKDKKIDAWREELGSVPTEANRIKEALNAKAESVKAAKQAVLNAKKDVQQLELDRQTRKETILKLKTRQGETKRNEEYQMLSHEIDRYSKEVDELETQELELMERVDEKQTLRVEAEEKFLKEKELVTEESQNLLKKKSNAEQSIKDLGKEREELFKKVDVEARELYERLRKGSGMIGVIVTVSSSGQCMGCNLKIPPATLHLIHAGNELVQCSECSRILYEA